MLPKSKLDLTKVPIIDIDDIFLRAIQYDDYEDLFEIGSDPRVLKWVSWQHKTINDSKKSIQMHLSRPQKGIPISYCIVHKQSNKMIGLCDFHKIDWEEAIGEIGYILHYDYWNKGYMTKACKALINFGFQYLGLKTIEISHDKNNQGSRSVIEKCGFKYVKKAINKRNNRSCYFYKLNKRSITNYNKIDGIVTKTI